MEIAHWIVDMLGVEAQECITKDAMLFRVLSVDVMYRSMRG